MKSEIINEYLIKAKNLQQNAYAPYSNFRVAAIVVSNKNQEYFGVNIENAAFPATICAERVAIAQAITQGCNSNDIKALFLITDSKELGSPCGICRQFMVETMNSNAKIYIFNAKSANKKTIKVATIAELLPFAFLPDSLIEVSNANEW